jgi:SAM-dependent methyltransferase
VAAVSEMFRKPAAAYDRLVGRYSTPLAAELIAFTGVEPGMRALDVGCGTGALTAVLAGILGAENVAGVEPSETFAAAARERVPGAEIVQAPAEALPFAGNSFDAVLSQLVVNFLEDAERGVREMARVTRPGGTVAACVWDYGGGMTLLRAFWDAAREVEPERAAAADEADLMEWTGDGELVPLWGGAGLEHVRSGGLTVRVSYADFDDLWLPFETGAGPAAVFAASLDDATRAQLREALRRRVGVGDEPFELTALAWAVAGTT